MTLSDITVISVSAARNLPWHYNFCLCKSTLCLLNDQTVVIQPRSFLHGTGHTQTKLQETRRKADIWK